MARAVGKAGVVRASGRPLLLRQGLAVVVWCTTVTLAVATVWLTARNDVGARQFITEFTGALLMAAVTTTTVGALIVIRRPTNVIGWLLCSGLLVVFTAAVGQYARLGAVTEPGSVPGAALAVWVNLWVWIPGLVVLAVFVPLLFPDGHLPSPRWRVVVWLAVGAAMIGVLQRALSPDPDPTLPQVANPYGVSDLEPVLVVMEGVWSLGVMLAAAGAFAALVVRFRGSDGSERRQLKWMLYATTLLVVAEVATPLASIALVGQVHPTAVAIAEAIAIPWLAFAVGIAILRHRLYDIDALISRSLVYGLLTVAVVALYAGVVGYFGAALDVRGGLVSLLAAAIVAVIFAPLRTALQRVVNRWVYGDRDDPYSVLSSLGRRLEATLEPDRVLPTIVGTVREALKLPYAEVRLAGSNERVGAGEPTSTSVRLPLLFGHQEVGELRLAPRTADDGFSAADRRLLDDFARQAAVAAHAVMLTTDLRHAHTRLVNAREEERRRLRRDLHDGLGPQLASQTLALDAARRLLSADPAGAEQLLVDMREQTQGAVTSIRRLIYDLRPPVLDDRGLEAALREELMRFQHNGLTVEVTCPQLLPALPAAVDVTVYRIALEAVTNVIRHANATRCEVALQLNPGHIVLVVRDDGSSISPDAPPGVGLGSMRERATALGGTFQVQGGRCGTVVTARIPLNEGG